MSRTKNLYIYENLDTSFVNLGALLRYLQGRDFNGRVDVHLGDYQAEIRLQAGARPWCRELDMTTGREGEGDAALQRLLVRAMEAGGRISVYREEAEAEEAVAQPEEPVAAHRWAGTEPEAAPREFTDAEIDWQGLLLVCAELIASVERAARSAGANFGVMFRLARLELADDYSFLDPNSGRFEYVNNEIELRERPAPRAFVSGLCEALRRVVEKVAAAGRPASVRERFALELAVLVRRHGQQLKQFGILAHLDRIAGTRVV